MFKKKKKVEREDVESEVATKETEKEPNLQIVVFDELILAELRQIRAVLERIEEQNK